MKNTVLKLAISVALLSSGSWGHAAITDSSGKLTITGEDYWTYDDHFFDSTLGRSSRLLWDGSRAHFQAGSGIKGSSSIGYESFAFGNHAWSQGTGSFAFGGSTASGASSFAFGNQVTTTSSNAFAFGRSNTSSGLYSLSFGNSNTVQADYGVGIGYQNYVSGLGSIALGQLNSIYFDPYMAGDSAGYAIGRGLSVGNWDAVVVGRFNTRASSWDDDFLFVVGNGTSGSNRSDAFAVDNLGNVWAAGAITAAGGIGGSNGSLSLEGSVKLSLPQGDIPMGQFTAQN